MKKSVKVCHKRYIHFKKFKRWIPDKRKPIPYGRCPKEWQTKKAVNMWININSIRCTNNTFFFSFGLNRVEL